MDSTSRISVPAVIRQVNLLADEFNRGTVAVLFLTDVLFCRTVESLSKLILREGQFTQDAPVTE